MEVKDNGGIRILQTETIARDNWLGFLSRRFQSRDGAEHQWSYVERNASRSAVVVIAHTQTSNSLVLIRQFRIPLAAWTYEFPAGLVDEGESLEQAALRELGEETGYQGTVLSVSPALPTSAGLSSEYIHLVRVQCLDIPGEHAREAAEAIEMVLIDNQPAAIRDFLDQAAREAIAIDAKLYTYLLGRLDN